MIFLNLKSEKKKVGVVSYNTSEMNLCFTDNSNNNTTTSVLIKLFKNVLTDMAKISESVVTI